MNPSNRNVGRDADPYDQPLHNETEPELRCAGPLVSRAYAAVVMPNARAGDAHNLVCASCGDGTTGTPEQVDRAVAADRSYLRREGEDPDGPEWAFG